MFLFLNNIQFWSYFLLSNSSCNSFSSLFFFQNFFLHCSLLFTLLFPKTFVMTVFNFDKFIVWALLNNCSKFQNNNAVTITDCWKSVSNNQSSCIFWNFVDWFLYISLSLSIKSRSCLIEAHDCGLFKQSSSNCNTLLLPTWKFKASFSYLCIITLRKFHHKFMNLSSLCWWYNSSN